MSVKYADLIDHVVSECEATDPRLKPEDFNRWARQGVAEVFLRHRPELRIQDSGTVLDIIQADEDENIPASLEPYAEGLERYIEYRYHACGPKNPQEAEAASENYRKFLATFGVNMAPQRGG